MALGRRTDRTLFRELLLYAASAALSYLVLLAGSKFLDPDRDSSQNSLQRKKDLSKRLGRPLIHTTPYEDVIVSDVVNPDHIDVGFELVGGLDKIKESLYELVILPLKRPELFASGKILIAEKGILMYGPPGTGKTMLAKAIAKESGAVFINVRLPKLMSKWFGDAQKLVAAVFSLAYKLQPAIIFIDEVDSFLGQRRDSDHQAVAGMKTEFMSLWDGFTTDQNARIMVLAATNRPADLDEAILRRFSQVFKVGRPDCNDREKILKVIMKDERHDGHIDFHQIARLSEGYTGSDLLELCKQAAYIPLRDFLNDEKNGKTCQQPRPLSQLDLEKVLATSRKSFITVRDHDGSSSSSPA